MGGIVGVASLFFEFEAFQWARNGMGLNGMREDRMGKYMWDSFNTEASENRSVARRLCMDLMR